jgi:hypothetical protein
MKPETTVELHILQEITRIEESFIQNLAAMLESIALLMKELFAGIFSMVVSPILASSWITHRRSFC